MKKYLCFFSLLIFFSPSWISANPSGGQVTQGTASITEPEIGHLVIESSSDRTVIEWDDFSIGINESVSITLPSSTSAILIKVKTDTLSAIDGTLTSNGKIYIENTTGATFGSGSLTNCAAFYALGLPVDSDRFILKKATQLRGTCDCHYTIQGSITARAGDIAILSCEIVNEGILHADQGSIYLGSGHNYMGAIENLDQLSVRQHFAEEALHATGIDQKGQLFAKSIYLQAHGKIASTAIHHTGSSISTGKIFFLSQEGIAKVAGTLSAPDKIVLIGDEVRLESGTQVNSYSDAGGGEVLIGGDYQGNNITIQNALRLYFDNNAAVNVNAQQSGNGGRVILWSEESTQFFGTILARGGTDSGNGGFIEVSSRGLLDFQGVTDRSAPNGAAGTLLLDPSNIALIGSGPGTSANIALTSPIVATASTALLANGDLQNQLNLGNVVVTTSSGFSENGDIFTDGNLTLDLKGNTLTFNAERDFIMGDEFNIIGTPGGTLNINAGRNYLQQALGVDEARLQSNKLVNLNITAQQDVIIELGSESIGFVQIDNKGPLTIIAGRDILVNNNRVSSTTAEFLDIDCYDTGNVLMQAGRTISMSSVPGSKGVHIGANASPGDFTMIANDNIIFGEGFSTTTMTYGEKPHTFTVVVDNNHPTSPAIGSSGLTIQGNNIDFSTYGGSNIRFFTARREQNSIGSNFLINGTSFLPGTLFVNTATEQWESYYPSTFGGVPFTLFYKNGFVLPPANLTAKVSKNKNQYIHTLYWQMSRTPNVVSYNVYIDNVFYTNVSSSDSLEAVIYNRSKKETYTYEVRAVTSAGDESASAIIVL